MKLSDATDLTRTRDKLSVLVYGLPGSGKDSLAATVGKLPDVNKIFLLDVPGEQGTESLVGTEITDKIKVFRVQEPKEVRDAQRQLLAGDHDFDALIGDSLSALERLYMRWARGITGEDIFDLNERTNQQEKRSLRMWGYCKDFIVETLNYTFNLASAAHDRPLHVIWTCQARYENREQEVTFNERMVPDVRPATVSPTLSTPNHVLYTYVSSSGLEDDAEPEYWVQLRPTDGIFAKVHLPPEKSRKLPVRVNADNFSLAKFSQFLSKPTEKGE